MKIIQLFKEILSGKYLKEIIKKKKRKKKKN